MYQRVPLTFCRVRYSGSGYSQLNCTATLHFLFLLVFCIVNRPFLFSCSVVWIEAAQPKCLSLASVNKVAELSGDENGPFPLSVVANLPDSQNGRDLKKWKEVLCQKYSCINKIFAERMEKKIWVRQLQSEPTVYGNSSLTANPITPLSQDRYLTYALLHTYADDEHAAWRNLTAYKDKNPKYTVKWAIRRMVRGVCVWGGRGGAGRGHKRSPCTVE
jgi:hypothetical protein